MSLGHVVTWTLPLDCQTEQRSFQCILKLLLDGTFWCMSLWSRIQWPTILLKCCLVALIDLVFSSLYEFPSGIFIFFIYLFFFRGLCKSINEIQSKFAMKALSCPWKSQTQWPFFFIARLLLAVLQKIALQKENYLKLKSLEIGFFFGKSFSS